MINIHPPMPLIGKADPEHVLKLVMVLRRRDDHPPITPFGDVPRHEFVAKHGAHPKDEAAVRKWCAKHGLTVVSFDPRSKQMIVTGPIALIEPAFNVLINAHQHPEQGVVHVHSAHPTMIPEIVSVMGLTTVKAITKCNFAVAPVNTNPLTIDQLTAMYSFPQNSAAGQVIGIYENSADSNHQISDIDLYFNQTFDESPTIINVMPPDNLSLNGVEANLDICVAASAAPGATIAMYYAPFIEVASGDLTITDPLTRMIHPQPGDPICTVISISYNFFDDGGDADLATPALHAALQSLFMDAAALGVTVVASAGDHGTGLAQALFGDASNQFAYIIEPQCNPYVLGVGGTVVGNIVGSSFEEYVWNYEDNINATGGGVSQFYAVPSYQANLKALPTHANTGATGRGVPDITGNASGTSGVNIFVNGQEATIGGTSLTAPLMAGLIAVINAAAGKNVGFINPILYNPANANCFRDITAATLGPPNNATGGAPGYAAATGWDGCSGLGVPIGTALLAAVSSDVAGRLSLSYITDGGTTVTAAIAGDGTFGFTHPAITTATGHSVSVFVTGDPTHTTATQNFTVASATTPGVVGNIVASDFPTSISIEWIPPEPQAPYTYQVKWGNSPSSLTNTGTTAVNVTNFTITGLTAGTNYFGSVTAIGPTGLIGAATTFSAATIDTTKAVTNIGAYFRFVANYLTAVQWDDVGATNYYIDYSTSPSGPWQTTSGSPWPTGYGAIAFTGDGSSMFPVAYPNNAIDSLHGGVVSPTTGLCTSYLQYWVRIRAQYSNGNITTSAPYQDTVGRDNPGLSAFGVYYPNVSGPDPHGGGPGVCQSLSAGTVDCQWNDSYPNANPYDGTPLTYTILLAPFNAGIADFGTPLQFGPVNTGFGYLKSSKPGALTGSINHLTGVPTGTYQVSVMVNGAAAHGVNGGGGDPFDAPSTVVVQPSGNQAKVVVVS